MKQYWAIKAENFDKLIFFKLGKFYELFYDDAIIGNKYLDLNWLGNKMHVGYHLTLVLYNFEKLFYYKIQTSYLTFMSKITRKILE